VRIRHGLYRLTEYPTSRREEILGAWLSVGATKGVISHESALDLLDLSDVIPGSIHITVPRSDRWRKKAPGTTLHTVVNFPQENEIVVREGVPVTTPSRTIIDAAVDGVGPEQIIAAIATALERRMTTSSELLMAAEGSGGRVEKMVQRGLDEAGSG